MVSETILVVLQYAGMFALSIVFSLLALDRKTLLSNLLASLLWLVLALANFIIGYTVIGSAFSWILGIVCFIFMGGFIMSLLEGIVEKKQQRFELGGI